MRNRITFTRKERILLGGWFLLLWLVVWIRAVLVPVVPDEVFSYFLYGESGFYFPPEAQIDANNHVVNSFLTHLSVNCFGHSLLAIRLPNVLCFVVYFIAIVGISKRQSTKGGFWISLFAFSGIFYLLEFFSLSRGYGMSFAFLLLGIWQLMLLQQTFRWKNVLGLLVATILALGSNLSLFFCFSVMTAWLVLLLGGYVRRNTRKAIAAFLTIGAFAGVLLFFYNYIVFLNNRDMLYYGLEEGFPYASIQTLLFELTTVDFAWMYWFLFVLSIGIVLLALGRLFSQRLWKSIADNRLVFVALLLANLAGIVYSVYKMDAAAPSDRTAAHLIPLFIGSGIFLFPAFAKSRRLSWSQLLFVLFPVVSFSTFSLHYNHFWVDDRIDHKAYEILLEEAQKAPNPVTISGFRYFDRMYAFENLQMDSRLPAYDVETWPNNCSDFFLLTPGEYNMNRSKTADYKVLFTDPYSGNMLLKRNTFLPRKALARRWSTVEPDSIEFLNLGSFPIDSLSARNMIADIRCRFQFEGSGEQFIATAALFDKDLNLLMLKESFHLNQIKTNWNNRSVTRFSIPFCNLPPETREIRLYIFNDKKVLHGKYQALTTLYQLGQ